MQLNSEIELEAFKISVVGAGSLGTAIDDLPGSNDFSMYNKI